MSCWTTHGSCGVSENLFLWTILAMYGSAHVNPVSLQSFHSVFYLLSTDVFNFFSSDEGAWQSMYKYIGSTQECFTRWNVGTSKQVEIRLQHGHIFSYVKSKEERISCPSLWTRGNTLPELQEQHSKPNLTARMHSMIITLHSKPPCQSMSSQIFFSIFLILFYYILAIGKHTWQSEKW